MDYFNPPEQERGTNLPAQVPSSSSSPPEKRFNRSSPSTTSASATNAAPVPSPGATRIRRRNRMITSCLECRRRKLKCDKSHPCTNCQKFVRDCVFLAPALDPASQLKLTEIKEKVGSLERLLERDVAKNASSTSPAPTNPAQDRALPDDADDDLPANDDERDLEPTPLAVVDAAYDLEGDNGDLLDLGIQLGKMRITERIGGFFRPMISKELEYTTSDSFSSGRKGTDDGELSSPLQSTPQLPPPSEWLKPGPAYILPSSGFFFGSPSAPSSLIDFLPSRLAADRLIVQYFECVHPICQILHRPTFERQYEAFWEEVALGIEPPNPIQTILFATMFSGVVSMDDSTVFRDFGVSRISLLDNFKLGTESALSRANFLRTTKIETLQGFVTYLIPLCRSELSRAHSVLVGAAIRMAECMGLHRDGETYGMTPIEIHVRRLIWHQLCFLDIRTCEAQGPRPTIRRDEFDTRLPINADDVDFHSSGNPPVVADRWTDATFCLIRFEINEMMRTIWVDRPRIERRKISLTAVLSKIETFRKNMAARYDHLIDDRVPVQRCAKLVKALLISRLHIMVLHRYHVSVVSPMPDRLRNIMLASGTTTIEMAVHLETIPELQPWSWYGGALNQYHTAFLLLMEVYVHPYRKEADRIWTCLDYIFECDPLENRRVKGKNILSELQQKTAVYQSMRGMRAPVVMEKHVGQGSPRGAGSSTRYQNSGSLHTSRTAHTSSSRATQDSPSGASSFVGKVPIPDTQFGGEPEGQTVWAFSNEKSPEAGSDSSSVPGFGAPNTAVADGSGQDDLMADIDWDAFDALFPPEQHSDFAASTYPKPSGPGSYY